MKKKYREPNLWSFEVWPFSVKYGFYKAISIAIWGSFWLFLTHFWPFFPWKQWFRCIKWCFLYEYLWVLHTLAKKSQRKYRFWKKSGISRQIRAEINILVTKSQFPENHEKCNNSSPNCLNKLIFGHKLLLRGPQKSIHWIFEILSFCPFFGHFWVKMGIFRQFWPKNGQKRGKNSKFRKFNVYYFEDP